jgi:hypothetical protein
MGLLSDVTVIIVIAFGLLFFFQGQLPDINLQDIDLPSGDNLGTRNYLLQLRNGWIYNPDKWPEWIDPPTAGAIMDALTMVAQVLTSNLGEKMSNADTKANNDVRRDTRTTIEERIKELEEKTRADTDSKARGNDTGGLDEDTKSAVDNKVSQAEEKIRADTDSKARGGDTGGLDEDTKSAVDNKVNQAEEKIRADADSKARGGDTGGLDEDTKSAVDNKVSQTEEKIRADADSKAKVKDTGGLDEDTKTAVDNKVSQAEEKIRADADSKARGGDKAGLGSDTKTVVNKKMREAEEKVRADADSKAKVKDTGGLGSDTKAAIDNKVSQAEEKVRNSTDTKSRSLDTGGLEGDTKTVVNKKMREAEKKVRNAYDARGTKSSFMFETRTSLASARTIDIVEKRIERGKDGKVKDLGSARHFTYDGKVYSAFGHIPTPKMSTRISKGFSSYASRQLSTSRKSLNMGVKMLTETVGPNIIDNGSKMAGNTLKFVAGPGLDILGVFQVINDGFYNFPDESEFINKSIVYKVQRQSVRLQLDTMRQYNIETDQKNKTREINTSATPYTKFPHIMGPLDKLDKDSQDPIVTETRVQYEVDRIRYDRLTTAGGTYYTKLRTYLTPSIYDSVLGLVTAAGSTSPDFNTKTLLSYVDGQAFYDTYGDIIETVTGVFTKNESDDLYREAFTAVCNYNGGVVYEDRQPSQVDSFDNTPMPTAWRPRFQCGWSTKPECQREADNWYNTYKKGKWVPGDYAEWFEFDDDALKNISTGSSTTSNYENATHAISHSATTAYGARECPPWFDIANRYTYMSVDMTNVLFITFTDSVYVYGYFITNPGTTYNSLTGTLLTTTNIKFGWTKNRDGLSINPSVTTGTYSIKALKLAPTETGKNCLPTDNNTGTGSCNDSTKCAPGYVLREKESCLKDAYALGVAVGAAAAATPKVNILQGALISAALVPAFKNTIKNKCRCVLGTTPEAISTDYPMLVPQGSKLRANGKTGACIVTNPGFRSMCAYGKGTYDQNSPTRCVYTASFCQTMGMCFDETSATCFLPSKQMFGASFLFGTGGPRQWIKVHGCKFTASGATPASSVLEMTGAGMLFTKDGRRMIGDALANAKRWPDNVKKAMQDPAYALMNISSVLGVGELRRSPFGLAMGSLSVYTAIAGLAVMAGRMGIQLVSDRLTNTSEPKEYAIGGFIEAGDDTTVEPMPLQPVYTKGWLTKPLDFLPLSPNRPLNKITEHPVSVLNPAYPVPYLKRTLYSNGRQQKDCGAIFAGDISLYVAANPINAEQNNCWQYKHNLMSTGVSVTVSFFKTNFLGLERVFILTGTADTGYTTLFTKYGTTQFFYVKSTTTGSSLNKKYRVKFEDFTDTFDGKPARRLLVWRVGDDDDRNTEITWDPRINDGWKVSYISIAQQYVPQGSMTFDILDGDRMIRGAQKAANNMLWCIPAKPPASIYVDTNIGTLAPEVEFMQNRSWTDGTDYESPVYPERGLAGSITTICTTGTDCEYPSECGFWDNTTNDKFYYQLVYDMDNMAVAETTLAAVITGGLTTTTINIQVASLADFYTNAILSTDTVTALGLTGTVKITDITSPGTLTLTFMEQSVSSVAMTQTITNFDGTTTSGVAVKIKTSMPKKLWNTNYMRKYFYDSTIAEMRRYYCQETFSSDMTGATVEPRCFGYISARTTNYVMLPMTTLSANATRIIS